MLGLLRLIGFGGIFLGYFLYVLARPVWGWSLQRRYRLVPGITQGWGRLCSRLAGYRVIVRGELPPTPCLLAPNHLGYADIVALASAVPTFFLSKAEVARWPLIGWSAKLYGHLFMARVRGKDALITAFTEVADRLRRGHRVCIFLEGTSSGGDQVLPFKPSLVQPAIEAGVPVVPVAIDWRSCASGLEVCEDIAYWKDHTFGAHFFRHLSCSGKAVTITFGTPMESVGRERRELAQAAQAAVQDMLAGAT